MSTPNLHRLTEHVLESYTDAHPDLKNLYHQDAITNHVMTACAIQGIAPIVMLFHLAKAQLDARKNIEQRYLEHMRTTPMVIFTPSPDAPASDATTAGDPPGPPQS